jgi:4a-hydroxytetrahydrobiopterin dehydratase
MATQPIEQDRLVEWNKDQHIWSVLDHKLMAEFGFESFAKALEFMNKVGALADEHNHHPTIENTYSQVKLSLTTHNAGNRITEKDLKLAEAIEKI